MAELSGRWLDVKDAEIRKCDRFILADNLVLKQYKISVKILLLRETVAR